MPLGLISGGPSDPSAVRPLLARLAVRLLQGGDFTEQFDQHSLKLCAAQPVKGGRRRHIMQRTHTTESAQGNIAAIPTLLPTLDNGKFGLN